MRNFYVFVTFFYININLFFSISLSDDLKKKFHPTKKPKESPQYKYNTQYIENVPVDHFDSLNTHRFKLKYLINDDYWNQTNGDPILFCTGNEGPVVSQATDYAFIWETAPELKALIVFAEHRYYGDSQPFGEDARENSSLMVYLTVQQALEDYIYLIKYLRRNQTENNLSPVIAIGGSYGGVLSAWIRMKYPGTVQGALASSAPFYALMGLTDCSVIPRTITDIYNKTRKNCVKNIRRCWNEIDTIGKTDKGMNWLQIVFNTCQEVKNYDELKFLKFAVERELYKVAMANYPYRFSYLGGFPRNPLDKFCKRLDVMMHGKQLLVQMSTAFYELFRYGNTKCIDLYRYDFLTPYDEDSWSYQGCTQMQIALCTDGKQDMFEERIWDNAKIDEDCYNVYKVKPQRHSLLKEFDPKYFNETSNIIFSNGLMDPFYRVGILENISSETVTIILDKAAHHLDLGKSNERDPISVTNARKYYKTLFLKWIFEFKNQKINLVTNSSNLTQT